VVRTGLISDGSGNLFGGRYYGGLAGAEHSAVYELAKGSSAVTTLASFDTSFGNISALTLDGSGDIFGTTFFRWRVQQREYLRQRQYLRGH